jgi:NACHT domain
MVTGLEVPLMKIVEASLSAAANSVGRRLWSGVDPMARRSRRRSTEIVSVLNGLEFAGRLSRSRLLETLPSKTNVHEVELLFEHIEVQGLLHELVASQIAGASAPRNAQVRENFAIVMANLLPKCPRAETILFGEHIYDAAHDVVMDLAKELKLKNPEAWADVQSAAGTNLVSSTLEAIERHNDSLKRLQDPALLRAAWQWEATYRQQAEKAHGFIEPPDFERKRKVPIESLYVAPRILPFGGPFKSGQVQSIDEFSRAIDRTVLLGDPGGGKSTAGAYLMYHASKTSDGPLPLLVILREFAKGEVIDQPIAEYIVSRIANYYQCPPPPDVIESFLLSGKAIVIFDGLDELVDSTRRRDITARVEMFSERYPLTRILVTSRRVGYEQAQLDTEIFETYVLSGFNESDVTEYVQRWFEHVELLEGEALAERVSHFVAECSGVPDLTSTPLMLSLMCILYRGQGYIPKNRPDVYERCAILLFDKWDSSRRIYADLRASAYIDPAMKHLAFWMLTEISGTEAVTESALVDEATSYLHDAFESDHERRRAAQEFVDFCRGRAWVLSDAGTTAEGQSLFKFTHRTFMEYFAAYELTRRSDGPEDLAKKLLPRIAAAEWDVVGQLAVQIQNKHSAAGSERVFKQLLKDKRRRTPANRDNILAFITRCLAFMDVPPAFARVVAGRAVASGIELVQHRGLPGQMFRLHNSSLALSELGRVSAEMRGSVSNELESLLVAMLSDGEGNNDDENRFAKSILLNWNIFLFGVFTSRSNATEEQHKFWGEWSSRIVEANIDQILVEPPENLGYWQRALYLGHVSVDRFLSVTKGRGDTPLDALVETSLDPILGIGYVPWASYAFDVMTSTDSDASAAEGDSRVIIDSSAPLRERLEPGLAELGRFVDDLDAPPWFTTSGWEHYTEVRSYKSRTDDLDADWGICVLAMAAVEVAEGLSGLKDENGIGEILWGARHEGATITDGALLGSIFDGLSTRRAGLLDDWLTGSVSFVNKKPGRPFDLI